MSDQADADEIRAKRLAKMNVVASSANASGSGGTAEADPTPPRPRPSVPKQAPSIQPKPVIRSDAMDVDQPVASSKPSPTVSAAQRQANQFLTMTSDRWEHQTVAFILQVDLDIIAAEAKGYAFLSSLVEDLVGEGITELQLSASLADRALHSRLSLPENAQPSATPLFDYLLSAWKRCGDAKRKIQQIQEKSSGLLAPAEGARMVALVTERCGVIDTVRGLIVSYAGFVILPDMADSFPQRQDILVQGPGYLAQKLSADAFESEDLFPQAFMDEFTKRFDGDGLSDIIGSLVNNIVGSMRFQNITTDYMAPIRAFSRLISSKTVCQIIVKLPNWCPENLNARTVEMLTILGPFFAKSSVFPDPEGKIAQAYFSSGNAFSDGLGETDNEGSPIGSRNLGDVRSAQSTLRGTILNVQSVLYNLIMTIVKTGPECREAVLHFLSTAISLNHPRGRMQVDRKTVATDGFLYNVNKLCLKLCDPFLDPMFSKVHLIEPTYFLRQSHRLTLPTGTTLLNADTETLDAEIREYAAKNPTLASPNFISDVFALTLGSHHFGLMSVVRYYGAVVKEISEMRKEMERMKAERDSGAWSRTPDGPIREMGYKRLLAQMDVFISHKLLLDTSLFDRAGVDHSLRFYNLVMVWLLRVIMIGSGSLASGSTTPDRVSWESLVRGNTQGLQIVPLPANVPASFATLPEWILEDLIEFYLFISRYKPIYFEGQPRDEFLTFSIALLKSTSYVKNPHLKSKLVEADFPADHVFFSRYPLYRTPRGDPTGPRLDLVFSTHPLSKQFLVSAMVKFYVEVENTGVSSAFYDKFNIRYNISQILKSVWDDHDHRAKVIAESKNTDQFVKFVNLLMNDTTYLLDESLTKLADIHKIQDEMANVEAWNATPQNTREERESSLRQYERMAQSYVALGNETVHMFQYLTAVEEIVTPFMAPYIVERLAAMLDFNLAALVGPRCTELKVKNPEKYGFDPKKLLSKIIDIFLNLSHRIEFVEAVSRDGRSYKKEIFQRAVEISTRFALKNAMEIQNLQDFVQKVEHTITNARESEEELGDAPDEFLDPLLATIMEDPVVLPTSGITIDRSTIITQLLSSPIDPFNRKPLTIDMVVPNTELKQRIEEWKRSVRTRPN
ncbi:ubiquitin elongating factor core-domain-containing protein [Zopfochytrium polystomum]|nr:ubiquitin elongating factor core-domain-containing protein [Zopfochytrium polystomum]